ncbi:uncharacterized protein LOC134209697 [Armigeres subalbatus]|uniref:uncharacterized protein LOC134209697 n=1 Tax=Armigeres subalbatus TaxID=124917 RepID=UPI002ED10858
MARNSRQIVGAVISSPPSPSESVSGEGAGLFVLDSCSSFIIVVDDLRDDYSSRRKRRSVLTYPVQALLPREQHMVPPECVQIVVLRRRKDLKFSPSKEQINST